MNKNSKTCPVWSLTRHDLVLLATLGRATRKKPRELRIEDLENLSGLLHRTIERALDRLESAGLIRIQRRRRGYPSVFKVLRPSCRWLQRIVEGRAAVPRTQRGHRSFPKSL